jgi:two-component system cell cycle response regulator
VAAVPGMQAGRVVATLTVGRSDPERPFDGSDREAIEDVIPLVTLSVTASLARREVEEGSPRDPTTGLYNRAFLEAALEQLLALRRRTPPEERQPLSLIMFDVDDFRLINERHGRQVGDHVLRAVATLLRQRFRASDTVARVGADSFVVVLNGASAEVASDAAAHVRRQVRNLSVAGAQGERVPVSISAGCALVRDVDRSDVLFRSVEAALATARWSGPGAVVSI